MAHLKDGTNGWQKKTRKNIMKLFENINAKKYKFMHSILSTSALGLYIWTLFKGMLSNITVFKDCQLQI